LDISFGKVFVSAISSVALNVFAIGPLLNPALGEPLKAALVGFPGMLGYPAIGEWLALMPTAWLFQIVGFLVMWLIIGGIFSVVPWPIIITALVVGFIVLLFTGRLSTLIPGLGG